MKTGPNASAHTRGDDELFLKRTVLVAFVVHLLFQWAPLAVATLPVPLDDAVVARSTFDAAHLALADRYAGARWQAFLWEALAAFGVLLLASALVRSPASSFLQPFRPAIVFIGLAFSIAFLDALVATGVRTAFLHPLDVDAGLSQLSAGAFARSAFVDALTTNALDATLFLAALFAWRWRPRALLLVAPACALAHAASGWLLVALLQPALAPVLSASAMASTCATASCTSAVEGIATDHQIHAPQTNLFFVQTSTFDQRVAAFASGPPPFGTLWFFDSSLRALSPEGARSMALHELAHFAYRHAWWEAAFDVASAFLFAVLWLWLTRRTSSRSLSLVLAWWILATSVQAIETPARLLVRRTFERQADAFAIRHGGLAAFVEVERVGNGQNLARYSERALVRVFLLDHDPPFLRLHRHAEEGF